MWQIYGLGIENLKLDQSAVRAEFETFLRFVTKIQDFYLPELRSNQRVGEYRDYRGSVAIGGTHFLSRTEYILSAVREWRRQEIEHDYFDPTKVLSTTGLDVTTLRHWISRFEISAESIDPLKKWQMLVKYVRYGKRQDLRFDALLAQDFYEIAALLQLFLEDLDLESGVEILTNRPSIAKSASTPRWMIERYGRSLSRPYEMLEFLSNEYDLNPKPRAIILTEGDEWKAVENLYAHYGFDAELLGIEFRSISGEGNFSLANWQCFIEYMHEKQVLIYFLLDNEGQTVKQAKRLLNKKRTFSFPGLSKVIPSRERIRVWAQSFEASNFTDAEIRRALAKQGVSVSSQQVFNFRRNAGQKGLVNALAAQLKVKVDKPHLDIDLVSALVSWRQKRPEVKTLRPIEKFVRRSGELILLNHQPVDQELRRLNVETGLLG